MRAFGIFLIGLLVVNIVLVGNGHAADTKQNKIIQTNMVVNDKEIYQYRWVLKSIDGEPVEGPAPTLSFDEEKRIFSGFTGCNSIGGQFESDADGVAFSRMRQTKMACPGETETKFTKNLASVDNYAIIGDTLSFSRNGENVLVFIAPSRCSFNPDDLPQN